MIQNEMQKVANFRHLRPAGTASMWGGSGSGQREAPRRHFKKAATPYEGPTLQYTVLNYNKKLVRLLHYCNTWIGENCQERGVRVFLLDIFYS